MVDAALQPVTVTITQDGQPVMDARVYFQNADSSLVMSALTDAQGKASALMQAGGYVTALDPYKLNVPSGVVFANELFTFAGVKPGDQLRLDRDETPGISIHVTAPADPSAAASTYWVTSTCSLSAELLIAPQGSANPYATGGVYLPGCEGATVDFVVYTKDANNDVVSAIVLKDVVVSDQLQLDLTQMTPVPTYGAATPRSYTWTNVPTDGTIEYRDYLATNRGAVFAHAGDASGTPTATAMNNMPTIAGAVNVVETRQAGDNVSHEVLEWGPYASTYSLDLGASLLPDLTDVPVFDESSHRFTWTESTGTLQPDFVAFDADARRGGDGRRWYWQLVAPHTAGAVQYPTIPTDVYDFNMKATDNPYAYTFALAKVPGGYDAARAKLLPLDGGPIDLVAGTTGRISVARLMLPLVVRQAPKTERPRMWHAPVVPPAARR